MDPLRITDAPSGGQQLHLNGFTYYKKNRLGEKTYWKCTRFRIDQCNATAITSDGFGKIHVVKEGEHQHAPLVSDDDDEMDTSDRSETQDSDSTSAEGPDDEDGHPTNWEEWIENSDDEEDEVEGDEVEEDETEGEEEESEEEYMPSDDEGFDKMIEKQKIHGKFLRLLRENHDNVRKAALEAAGKDQICFIIEICLNVLRGYFRLSKYELNALRPFKEILYFMINEKMPWREKQQLLVDHQEYPFLPVLLNILAQSQHFK